MPSYLSCYSLGAQDHGNQQKGILGNHQGQRLLSQSFISSPLRIWSLTPLCLRLSSSPGFHFTLKAQLCRVRRVVEQGAGSMSHSWFMALWCRSQVQTCQGVRGCCPPALGLVAAEYLLATWGRNAYTASLQICAASTARELDESCGFLVICMPVQEERRGQSWDLHRVWDLWECQVQRCSKGQTKGEGTKVKQTKIKVFASNPANKKHPATSSSEMQVWGWLLRIKKKIKLYTLCYFRQRTK